MANDTLSFGVILSWSQEDGVFIAGVPELPGCAADGPTCGEALAAVEIVAREWIETARELGWPIPEPWESGMPGSCGNEVLSEKVVPTRNGPSITLVVRLKDMDEEQVKLGSSDAFWELMAERRRQEVIDRAELERRLAAHDADPTVGSTWDEVKARLWEESSNEKPTA
jgi:putative addiction module component (TIGR02574 family)